MNDSIDDEVMDISKLQVQVDLYQNKRIAIQLNCANGMPYSTLTTNLVDAVLQEDQVCVASWNNPPELLEPLLASGKFEDTGIVITTGYAEALLWRVKCPDLLAKATTLRALS